jgi:hypothetical protein
MRLKVRSSVLFRVFSLFLFLAVVIGCGARTPQLGTYVSDTKDPRIHREASLELKEAGVGVWRVGDDEVTFSWYSKGNELRFHTKTGGVIVAHLDNEIIHVTIPGSEDFYFKKVK